MRAREPRVDVVYAILTGIVMFTCTIGASAQDTIRAGRALFVAERKGNCAACHKTPTDSSQKSVSAIGPPLEAIKQKYSAPTDRARLRNVIWDSSKVTPDTIMPPYGKHHILTETEIDAIVTYLESL